LYKLTLYRMALIIH